MTLHLLDIASYQAGLDLAKAKAAGFGAVNIKTTQGNSYVFDKAPDWAKEARRLGMGISTFHWLDNSASGTEQARIAFQWMQRLGGPDGMAHQCDNEDTATWQITRDYAAEMKRLLGRPIAMYTGDWWWTARNWGGSQLTPYVWAAPNAGYLGSYPGDASPHWVAGYGGWGDYAVLQYAVQPIAGAGGGDISKSAIRDPSVWAALTGSNPTGGQTDMTPQELLGTTIGGTATGAHGGRDRNVAEIIGDEGRERAVWYGEASAPANTPLARVLDMPARMAALEAKLDALAARPTGTPITVDASAIDAAIASPAFVASVVKAVNDEIARRMAS